MRPRIAVLASGGGTTVEAFIRAGQRGEINVDVGLVIASRKNAGVFDRITSNRAPKPPAKKRRFWRPCSGKTLI
jgi:folate-dependent phosphoribosylglycinamide formyltransferase PurN